MNYLRNHNDVQLRDPGFIKYTIKTFKCLDKYESAHLIYFLYVTSLSALQDKNRLAAKLFQS